MLYLKDYDLGDDNSTSEAVEEETNSVHDCILEGILFREDWDLIINRLGSISDKLIWSASEYDDRQEEYLNGCCVMLDFLLHQVFRQHEIEEVLEIAAKLSRAFPEKLELQYYHAYYLMLDGKAQEALAVANTLKTFIKYFDMLAGSIPAFRVYELILQARLVSESEDRDIDQFLYQFAKLEPLAGEDAAMINFHQGLLYRGKDQDANAIDKFMKIEATGLSGPIRFVFYETMYRHFREKGDMEMQMIIHMQWHDFTNNRKTLSDYITWFVNRTLLLRMTGYAETAEYINCRLLFHKVIEEVSDHPEVQKLLEGENQALRNLERAGFAMEDGPAYTNDTYCNTMVNTRPRSRDAKYRGTCNVVSTDNGVIPVEVIGVPAVDSVPALQVLGEVDSSLLRYLDHLYRYLLLNREYYGLDLCDHVSPVLSFPDYGQHTGSSCGASIALALMKCLSSAMIDDEVYAGMMGSAVFSNDSLLPVSNVNKKVQQAVQAGFNTFFLSVDNASDVRNTVDYRWLFSIELVYSATLKDLWDLLLARSAEKSIA